MSDVVVIGSGVAGISCALTLLENGHSVTMITKARAIDSATWYAQGGVASAMFTDDSIESHFEDTIIAGVGLCNGDAVKTLVTEGASALQRLISRGAQFDRLDNGSYARTREGGHHNPRIIHAGGDKTGEEIERALVKKAENISIDQLEIIEHHMATKIIVENNVCKGIEFCDTEGDIFTKSCNFVVVATGGAGQIFATTTNPVLATADGLALALEAGAICADLEFMQFHPTALHVPLMPRPLISEAVRGEGAILRDEKGIAFMFGSHELADLAPRDVVSKEIAKIQAMNNIEYVFLDATMIEDFENRFPTIFDACKSAGLNPSIDYLPVSPAAHYYCGGVVTDLDGITSIDGLYAAGEVACTGIHGANRLASNSLLEGLVFGERVAQSIISSKKNYTKSGIFAEFVSEAVDNLSCKDRPYKVIYPHVDKLGSELQPNHVTISQARKLLQKTMTLNFGVVRSRESIELARKELEVISNSINLDDDSSVFSKYEFEHLLILANAMIKAGFIREESRGCHVRSDYTEELDEFLGRVIFFSRENVKFMKFLEVEK